MSVQRFISRDHSKDEKKHEYKYFFTESDD